MNYDTMRVHELVEKAMEMMALLALKGIPIDYLELEKVESALRKEVIREASVKTLHVKTKETGRNEYGVWEDCMVNGVAVEGRQNILRTLPDGDYAIVSIPKETP